MHVIGEDVSEQLDVIPAVLQVKRIHRPRYGCRSCEGAVVQVKAPPRLIDNGMATTALVTSIVVAKFAWHLPLNRQTHMFRGYGIVQLRTRQEARRSSCRLHRAFAGHVALIRPPDCNATRRALLPAVSARPRLHAPP